MVTIHCDGCGREIEKNTLRYTVQVDVRAAYDEIEVGLMELVRDHKDEMLRLINQMEDQSAEAIEETIYKRLKLDLCPACQRTFLRDPLRFQPGEETSAQGFEVDNFLRSLGYGGGSTDQGRDREV